MASTGDGAGPLRRRLARDAVHEGVEVERGIDIPDAIVRRPDLRV